MYRARAEKVSGKNVYAGGKWLICIGNKPVSVGDLIFTDGRCVYGFYQEAQQPMVITSQKIDEFIPILAYDSEKNIWECYVLKIPSMQLKKIGTIKLKSERWHMITKQKEDSTNTVIYVDKDILSYLFISSSVSEWAIRAYGHLTFYDSSIDSQNNLYEIRCIDFDYPEDRWIKASILKNGEVTKTKSFEYLARNPYVEHGYTSQVLFASIENEYKWAIIIEMREWGGVMMQDPTLPAPPDTITSLDLSNRDIHLITPTDDFRLVKEDIEGTYSKGYGDGENAVISHSQSFSNPVKIKIPIDDSYYFIINNFFVNAMPDYTSDYNDIIYNRSLPPQSVPHMNVTIYKADESVLLTANFPLWCKFKIYKDKVLNVYTHTKVYDSTDLKIYGKGLYLITYDENEPLKLLLNRFIGNENFKPIKNYKDWFLRVKQRYDTPVEPSSEELTGVQVEEDTIYT